jgi:hypothetical protein
MRNEIELEGIIEDYLNGKLKSDGELERHFEAACV